MPTPGPAVLHAFSVAEADLRPLAGGQGVAWTDGRLVLKPVSYPPEHAWVCEAYSAWTDHDLVRVPEPVKSAEGRWTAHGWEAHIFVRGRDVVLLDEVDLVKRASDAFHSVVSTLPPPPFVESRDDPWAFGDRVAWESAQPQGDLRTLALIGRLRDALEPVQGASQVIHGDILPNVLVEAGLPLAVIDWPPYVRPAGTANAIAATDAVTFRRAPLTLFDDWEDSTDWNQLLVRALLYRLGTTGWFGARDRLTGSLRTHVERAEPVVSAVLNRLS